MQSRRQLTNESGVRLGERDHLGVDRSQRLAKDGGCPRVVAELAGWTRPQPWRGPAVERGAALTVRSDRRPAQGLATQFQVCQTVALPSVAGRFHSPDSHTWPPEPTTGSGIAPA